MERKEAIHIIIAIIIMAIVIHFSKLLTINQGFNLVQCLLILLYSAIIISLSVLIKKLVAYRRDISIQHKILTFQKYWFPKKSHFKKPIPLGIILPLFLSAVSAGFIKCFTLLQFDPKPMSSRVVKAKGFPRTYEINDSDLGIIIFWSVVSLLALSLIFTLFLTLVTALIVLI
jgi:hypothetical protein